MHQLGASEAKILDFIKHSIVREGRPPTLRQIMKKFSFSSLASPRYYLRKLQEKNFIAIKKGVARGIELLAPAAGIPVIGEISAGLPLEAVENIEGYIDMVNTFTGKRPLFCLRVRGASMIGPGIMENDLVIVRKQETAQPGEIVAALIEDEALVKRLVKKGKSLFLKAENKSYPDIKMGPEARVAGKVVGVLRGYEPIPVY